MTMSERMEEDLMQDLYDEAEGPAQTAEEGFEEFEEEDLAEEGEWEGAEEDVFEEGFEEGFEEEDVFEGEEGFEEDVFDEGEEYGDVDEAELEEAMAYALGAEDTDEFFRRAFRAVRRVAGGAARVARRVAPVVGRIARVAAPIARAIPHPWAQAAAPALGLLGRLRAEGATEEEAMDAFAELAAYDETAIPIVAGLAARTLMRGRAARLPMAARRQLVRGMGTAARQLAQRRGPTAVRALPRIVRSVRRTAAVRRTPARTAPRIVQRTAARVARTPGLARRLSRPAPAARRRVRAIVRRVGGMMPGGMIPGIGRGPGGRTINLRGPVRITIRSAA